MQISTFGRAVRVARCHRAPLRQPRRNRSWRIFFSSHPVLLSFCALMLQKRAFRYFWPACISSPLAAQPEPTNLEALKDELSRRWPMTSLLDILKETDLRIDFTKAVATAAACEAIDRDEMRRWLLRCLSHARPHGESPARRDDFVPSDRDLNAPRLPVSPASSPYRSRCSRES
jgi:hypothetical protein